MKSKELVINIGHKKYVVSSYDAIAMLDIASRSTEVTYAPGYREYLPVEDPEPFLTEATLSDVIWPDPGPGDAVDRPMPAPSTPAPSTRTAS